MLPDATYPSDFRRYRRSSSFAVVAVAVAVAGTDRSSGKSPQSPDRSCGSWHLHSFGYGPNSTHARTCFHWSRNPFPRIAIRYPECSSIPCVFHILPGFLYYLSFAPINSTENTLCWSLDYSACSYTDLLLNHMGPYSILP